MARLSSALSLWAWGLSNTIYFYNSTNPNSEIAAVMVSVPVHGPGAVKVEVGGFSPGVAEKEDGDTS
jgi:hypothetical protein